MIRLIHLEGLHLLVRESKMEFVLLVGEGVLRDSLVQVLLDLLDRGLVQTLTDPVEGVLSVQAILLSVRAVDLKEGRGRERHSKHATFFMTSATFFPT